MKRSVIARPAPILAACRAKSGLEEELHFDAGELNHVVVLERVRRGADLVAVHRRALVALDVGDEVTLRAAGKHCYLNARLAKRSQRLGELELLAGVAAREKLDRTERLCARLRRWGGHNGRRGGRSRSRRRGWGFRARVLVGDAGGLRARGR